MRYFEWIWDGEPYPGNWRWCALFAGSHGARISWRSPWFQGRLKLNRWVIVELW